MDTQTRICIGRFFACLALQGAAASSTPHSCSSRGFKSCTSPLAELALQCAAFDAGGCAEQVACTCVCGEGYGGRECDSCAPGYSGYPDCVACGRGRAGADCGDCAAGYAGYPNCTPCGEGRLGARCEACACGYAYPGCARCRDGQAGEHCESCARGFTGHPDCRRCGWQDFARVALSGACRQPSIDRAFCRQFAAARVLAQHQCPGGAGAPCARAHQLSTTMGSFFVVNLLDMIVVCLSLLPVAGLIFVHRGRARAAAAWKTPLALCLGALYLVDLGLQLAALALAFGGSTRTAEDLLAAACMNDAGNYALVEFREGLETIRVLGVIELAVGAFGIILDAILVLDKDPERLLLVHVLEVGVSLADILLSSIEFAKFTLEARDKANNIFGAMGGDASGDIRWCVASVDAGDSSCWSGSAGPDCAAHTGSRLPAAWVALIVAGPCCCLVCVACAACRAHRARKRAPCREAVRKQAAREEAAQQAEICDVAQMWFGSQNDA